MVGRKDGRAVGQGTVPSCQAKGSQFAAVLWDVDECLLVFPFFFPLLRLIRPVGGGNGR